jgi:DNA-binding MarR family transcriptional regulator
VNDDRIARIQAEWARERPDVDVAPQGVIGRLHRIGALLMDELDRVFAAHGLADGEFDVLATLRRAGDPYERTAGELADSVMVTTGGLTKRVDRLERAGLVTRRRAEHDGRSRVVALTPQGLALIDEAFAAHMANERRLLDALEPRQAAQLEGLLAVWLGRLET